MSFSLFSLLFRKVCEKESINRSEGKEKEREEKKKKKKMENEITFLFLREKLNRRKLPHKHGDSN